MALRTLSVSEREGRLKSSASASRPIPNGSPAGAGRPDAPKLREMTEPGGTTAPFPTRAPGNRMTRAPSSAPSSTTTRRDGGRRRRSRPTRWK